MTENAGTTAPPSSETPPVTEPVQLPDDHPLVKTLAAQKDAIRDLKVKASRLDEIEQSQKSESEKAAERLATAERRAVEAEAKAARRDIALEHSLSKDDAALLDSLTDEDAMQQLAKRLAAASNRQNGAHAPREGNSPKSGGNDDMREFARNLFARGTAD